MQNKHGYFKIDDLHRMVEDQEILTIYVPIPQAEDGKRVAPTYLQFEAFAFLDKFFTDYGQREIRGNINGDMFWINHFGM